MRCCGQHSVSDSRQLSSKNARLANPCFAFAFYWLKGALARGLMGRARLQVQRSNRPGWMIRHGAPPPPQLLRGFGPRARRRFGSQWSVPVSASINTTTEIVLISIKPNHVFSLSAWRGACIRAGYRRIGRRGDRVCWAVVAATGEAAETPHASPPLGAAFFFLSRDAYFRRSKLPGG